MARPSNPRVGPFPADRSNWRLIRDRSNRGEDLLTLLREDQTGRWSAGESIRAEDYLAAFPNIRAEDLLVLILGEATLEREFSGVPSVADYQRRFPTFREDIAQQFEILTSFASVAGTNAGSKFTTEIGYDSDRQPVEELPKEFANHPRYELIRVLGRGGMGTVYLARHKIMKQNVAIKVMRPEFLSDNTAIRRFRQEVEAAGRLDHPHIVRALDADACQRLHFFVMEYIDGQNLGEILEAKGGFPISEACRYAVDAATALEFASERGIIHRDIKPQNLILTPDGHVKVLDFGLARMTKGGVGSSAKSEITGLGVVVGTPEYVSPEQAADPRNVDLRSDIFSLGRTLQHLLDGKPPGYYGPILESRRDAPNGLKNVIAKMTNTIPPKRYQSYREVLAALRPYAYPKPKTWVDRSWWLIVGIAASVAAYLGWRTWNPR